MDDCVLTCVVLDLTQQQLFELVCIYLAFFGQTVTTPGNEISCEPVERRMNYNPAFTCHAYLSLNCSQWVMNVGIFCAERCHLQLYRCALELFFLMVRVACVPIARALL